VYVAAFLVDDIAYHHNRELAESGYLIGKGKRLRQTYAMTSGIGFVEDSSIAETYRMKSRRFLLSVVFQSANFGGSGIISGSPSCLFKDVSL
jgi:hypothetical protein